jgi:hypothetical protein
MAGFGGQGQTPAPEIARDPSGVLATSAAYFAAELLLIAPPPQRQWDWQ